MIFSTLYKTDGNWFGDERYHPKNHLALHDGHALCKRTDACGMNGAVEYTNGVWYMQNIITRKFDIFLPWHDIRNICKTCRKKAMELESLPVEDNSRKLLTEQAINFVEDLSSESEKTRNGLHFSEDNLVKWLVDFASQVK